MSEIKWEDPPPDRGSKRWAGVVTTLREHPGKWAKIAEGTYPGLRGNIMTGALTAFRPVGSFEAVARKDGNGHHDIYARYIGENGEHR